MDEAAARRIADAAVAKHEAAHSKKLAGLAAECQRKAREPTITNVEQKTFAALADLIQKMAAP